MSLVRFGKHLGRLAHVRRSGSTRFEPPGRSRPEVAVPSLQLYHVVQAETNAASLDAYTHAILSLSDVANCSGLLACLGSRLAREESLLLLPTRCSLQVALTFLTFFFFLFVVSWFLKSVILYSFCSLVLQNSSSSNRARVHSRHRGTALVGSYWSPRLSALRI